MYFTWLQNRNVISLIRLLDNFFDRLSLCTSRKLEISDFYNNNYVFALKVTKEKWLPEFPKINLVLDRLEKRDPFFILPSDTNYDFLYYHLLCSKKGKLSESDKLGFKINYSDVEVAAFGRNATDYFTKLCE